MVRRIVLGVLLLLVIILCTPSVLHIIRGIRWLRSTNEPFVEGILPSNRFGWVTYRELQEISMALQSYHDVYDTFPAGGTFSETGEARHSWMSSTLSFGTFVMDGDLREDEPWNSEHNSRYFRTVVPIFVNARLPAAPVLNENGFALSHFAANQHVMGPNLAMKLEDITDGAGNTLLVGEVNSLFQPWGAPTNWRDPLLGLNTSPRGFGSHPDHGGVNFIIGDGSVRFLSNEIDPDVLKALSTPAGGESVNESDW